MLTAHYVGGLEAIDEGDRRVAADPTAEDAVSRLELTLYMRNQLLRDADVMSMASGVELRVPFIDSVLFERLARLPADQRLQPRKGLLLQAVPELPAWVTSRPKRGFTLPIDQWFTHDWAGSVRAPGAPAAIRMDTWYRKFSVLAFENWRQRLTPQYA